MNNIGRAAQVVADRFWTAVTVLMVLGLTSAGALPGLARAQQQLTGTTTVINNGVGDQINPHVDCSLASYTDAQATTEEVHYF